MKVLKGGLCEIKYSWPQQEAIISNCEPQCIDSSQNDTEAENELQEISRSAISTNDVCYINGKSKAFLVSENYFLILQIDNIGLHRVENSSNTDTSVSLHLYCPPFDSCSIFNKAGKRSQSKVKR